MSELEKHTEMYQGKRVWRADSQILGNYFNSRGNVNWEGGEKVRDDIFQVLEEAGFNKTPLDYILSIGEKDGEDSHLYGRLEVIWFGDDTSLKIRNRHRSIEVYCLTEFFTEARELWFEQK